MLVPPQAEARSDLWWLDVFLLILRRNICYPEAKLLKSVPPLLSATFGNTESDNHVQALVHFETDVLERLFFEAMRKEPDILSIDVYGIDRIWHGCRRIAVPNCRKPESLGSR
jgi:hypothetical protein